MVAKRFISSKCRGGVELVKKVVPKETTILKKNQTRIQRADLLKKNVLKNLTMPKIVEGEPFRVLLKTKFFAAYQ